MTPVSEKELAVCDECGSLFFKESSQMETLCPECAHILYGYKNCDHKFQDGRCIYCYWDGTKSEYVKKLFQQEETIMPMIDWPKQARTADWESGVLRLDREKQFEVSELTMEIMERLAGYALVGFHVKGYPVTDELLTPFAAHKYMANFGVEDGALTDACFQVFSEMPKLRYLLLDGNAGINGSGLSVLQNNKLDLVALNRTGLNDTGLLQAASIPKLTHIQIDDTAVTYEGLLAVADNNRIEPVVHKQFSKEQMEHFSKVQREKAKKPVALDEQAAEECRKVLTAFFEEMTAWEQFVEQVGFENKEVEPRIMVIWEKYVSEKPRAGYRPLGLSISHSGTYFGEQFIDAEQITKNKLYIYTREKNTGFDRRFLMKRVEEGWKIDAVQERLDGWQRTGL